jgi:hypothetical protein
MLMTLKVIAPVTWEVRAFVEPADLRSIIVFVLRNPKVLLKALSFIILGGKSPSLVVNKNEPGKEGAEKQVPSLANTKGGEKQAPQVPRLPTDY